MKNMKGFVLGLVLGLGLALSGLAFAQNTNDASKKTNSCCAMESCCKGDSCLMMKDGAMKEGATKSDKHECCCCGDSCNMKNMKDMKMKDMKDMKKP